MGVAHAGSSERIVWRAAMLCTGGAIVALAAGLVARRPLDGLALTAGLLLAAGNPFLVRRSVQLGIAFAALSLLRLLVLSAAVLALGALLGWNRVWLVAIGVAGGLLVTAGLALREAVRT